LTKIVGASIVLAKASDKADPGNISSFSKYLHGECYTVFCCCETLIASKAAAGRRHELDQYGNIKKAATRPKARRYSTDALSDRELLLLAVLSMWRSDADFYMTDLTIVEAEEWLKLSLKIWDAPVDVSVKYLSSNFFPPHKRRRFRHGSLRPLF
jgi:hypothetical protein